MISLKQQRIIKDVTARINPTFLGIFGSHARGDQHAESDLDILIDFDAQVDLLELIGLEQELSELLGVKVDLITMRSLHAALKPHITSDLIRIL